MPLGKLLHVGCGGDPLPYWLSRYMETRLDIDPAACPDIVANMCDLGDIGTYDAIYCSHALEHLEPHNVKVALDEFYRVLNPGGAVIVFVPDLENVRATEDVLLIAPVGPITGLDLIYGYRPMLKDKPYMAHRTGFTKGTLLKALNDSRFVNPNVIRLKDYALMGAAAK